MKYQQVISIFLLVFLPFILIVSTHKDASCQDIASEFEPLITDIVSYFKPVSGVVLKTNDAIVIDKGQNEAIKKGMRVSLFREDLGFVHPVTRENLGKIEKMVGLAEITNVSLKDAQLKILSGEIESIDGLKYKIKQSKIKALFLQTNINWYLADIYYHILKSNGRFELIDSSLDAFDITKLSQEAKKQSAEIIVVIDSEKDANKTQVRQRVYWASDMAMLTEKKVDLSSGFVQSIMNKQTRFVSADSNILLTYQVSRQIQRIALTDLDGDGNQEIILATRDNFAVYQLGTDLKLIWEFKTAVSDEILWLDVIRFNNTKGDSVVLTIMKDKEVKSIIYKMENNQLQPLVIADSLFLRVIGNTLIGQEYSKIEGFENKVFEYHIKDGKLIKSEAFPIPKGVNLYDFCPIESPDGKKALLTLNDNGFLTVFSNKGIILWQSNEEFGGYSQSYKKLSNIEMIDRGQWSIKDRLISRGGGVLIPKRNPIFGYAKGLGYKSTDIILLWYNGITVEQNKIIENLDGEVLDYNITDNRLIVLSKPPLGVKPANILKGQNPFVNTIKIINLKGIYN
ncbi:MAG: VCBS repeat-containing protein [Thermodesulfovibrionales bacterium]|nr:VCBS repeat-containing protein [Thermodesulfovibrionales bacterium]